MTERVGGGGQLVRWTAAVAAGVVLMAGVFVLGRLTAGTSGPHGSYQQGLQVGEAQGRAEGRAEQAGAAVPSASAKATVSAFDDGYTAGENDAFGGYDGGWAINLPYVVTLAVGNGPIVYRIASRTPFQTGVDYYLCPDARTLCQQPRS
jgi:hypothetical protein